MHATVASKSWKIAGRSLVFLCPVLFFAQTSVAVDEKSIAAFTKAMINLAPSVDPTEAERVSVISHTTSRQLAKDYRVVGPPFFQNFLIHIGVRQKGYCYHWAFDIGQRLKQLQLKTLVLHWGASDEGTRLESNCIVVSAVGQPFQEGYIIDAWRNAGRLCWWPVLKDSSFVWKENLQLSAWLQNAGPAKQKPQTATVEVSSTKPKTVPGTP